MIFQNPAPEILEWAQNLKPELGAFERGAAPSVFFGENAAEYHRHAMLNMSSEVCLLQAYIYL